MLKTCGHVSLAQNDAIDASVLRHVSSLERSVTEVLEGSVSGVHLIVLLTQHFPLLYEGVVHVRVKHVPLVQFSVQLLLRVSLCHVSVVPASRDVPRSSRGRVSALLTGHSRLL